MVQQQEFHVDTSGHRDMHDITDRVAEIVAASGIRTGIVHVFNVGSTARWARSSSSRGWSATCPELLDRLIPPSRDYGHEQAWHDGNGHSHLQATWLGPSLTVPVAERRTRARHLAADLSPGVRRQAAATEDRGHGRGGLTLVASAAEAQDGLGLGWHLMRGRFRR